ncbi:MAG TPA: X2-like carbohydrate binding domain-containing protein [Clostridia bacterium]
MKKFSIILSLVLLISCLCPAAFAQGVEVYPATITGQITLNGMKYTDKVERATVYADNYDGYNANVEANKDGTYSLTVNAPADGAARTFNVHARVYLTASSLEQFDAGEPVRINVVKGGTYKQDFSQDMATLNIDASFTNDDWQSLSPFYNSGSYQYIYYNLGISKTGTHTVDIPANVPFKWVWGYAYPKNTDKFDRFTLDKKEFTAKPGETVNLIWNGSFLETPAKCKIHGTISYSPLPEGTLTQHYINIGSANASLKADGNYQLNNVTPGNSQVMTVYSCFNNHQYLYWPYINSTKSNTAPFFNLSAGEDKTVNYTAVPSMIKGKVNMTGSLSLNDLTSNSDILLTGKYNTDMYGAGSRDYFDTKTGDYALYLIPGGWDLSNNYDIYFSSNLSDPAKYMNGNFYYRASSNASVTVEPGKVTEQNAELPTGLVTIKFTSSDGSLIKNPFIQGIMNESTNGSSRSCNVYGNGPSQALSETQATIAAPPGTYVLNTSAYVNNSNITFEPKVVVVVKGVHTVLEVNGPTLNVTGPQAELYTDGDKITVKGTATDDVQVRSVKINGTEAKLTSTANAKDPNEVKFEEEILLSKGPNKIETIAYDSSGKISSDTRYVYVDSSSPVLSVDTPDGISTDSDSMVISGKATDDSKIDSITINGSAVDFIASGNPADPNEVSFKKTVSLSNGINKFTVSANDNCKRSTSTTISVTKVDNATLSPAEIRADRNALLDVTATVYGNTPSSIMNGTGVLIPDKDYTISGNSITIKKGYLTYYFTKFPEQNLYLNVILSNGKSVVLTVYTGGTSHPEISSSSLIYTGTDVTTGCTLNGNYIASVKNGDTSLLQRIDYTYSNDTNKLVIRKGFLETYFSRNTAALKLDIKFTGGDVKTITISK